MTIVQDQGRQLLRAVVGGSLAVSVVGAAVPVFYFELAPGDSWLYDLAPAFDLSGDSTVGTWFAAVTLLLAAGLLALVAASARQHRRHWAGLALLLLALSIDEVALGHERLGGALSERLGGTSGAFLYTWVLLGVPAVLVVTAVYARFTLSLPRSLSRAMVLAAVVYVAGALGMEMVNASTESAQGDALGLRYGLGTWLEESLEMAGVALLVRALLQHFGPLELPVLHGPVPPRGPGAA